MKMQIVSSIRQFFSPPQPDDADYFEAVEELSDTYPHMPDGYVQCGLCGDPTHVEDIADGGVRQKDDGLETFFTCVDCVRDSGETPPEKIFGVENKWHGRL